MNHFNVTAVSFSDQIFINASIDDQMRLNIVFRSSINISPYLNAAVMVDNGNGLYDMEYFNRTIDICKLLSDSKYEPFLQLVVRTTLPASNFPKKCPIGKVISLSLVFSMFSMFFFCSTESILCEKLETKSRRISSCTTRQEILFYY